MPRLVRIALTLFLSATVLTLLIRQRAVRLQNGYVADELARSEGQMIAIGLLLAALLAAGGFVLIIITIVRSRKSPPRNEG